MLQDDDFTCFLREGTEFHRRLPTGLFTDKLVQIGVHVHDTAAKGLATTNWELLKSPTFPEGKPLATLRNVALYRSVSKSSDAEPPPEVTCRLRVLMVLTFPQEKLCKEGVRWVQELPDLKLEDLRESLEKEYKRLSISAVSLFDTPDSPVYLQGHKTFGIRERLEQERFSVLHIITHGKLIRGTPHLSMLNAPTDYPTEDDPGRRAVSKQILEEVFTRLDAESKPRLVVLQNCFSGAGGMHSLAAALSSAGIPAVIGMQRRLGDEEALRFNSVFYGHLRSKPVEVALAHTRSELCAPPISESYPQLWNTPALFKHSRELVRFGVDYRDKLRGYLEQDWREFEREVRNNTPLSKYQVSQEWEVSKRPGQERPVLDTDSDAGANLEKCLDFFDQRQGGVIALCGDPGCGRTRTLQELMVRQIERVRAQSTEFHGHVQAALPLWIEVSRFLNNLPGSLGALLKVGFERTSTRTVQTLGDSGQTIDDWLYSDHFLILIDDADLVRKENWLSELIEQVKHGRHNLAFTWTGRLPRALSNSVDVGIELRRFSWERVPDDWGICKMLDRDEALRELARWPAVAASFERVSVGSKTNLLDAWVEDELNRALQRCGITDEKQREQIRGIAYEQLEHVGHYITRERRESTRKAVPQDRLFREEESLKPEHSEVNRQAWEALLSRKLIRRVRANQIATCSDVVTEFASARWISHRLSKPAAAFSRLVEEDDYIMNDNQARIQDFLASLMDEPAHCYLLIQSALGSGKRKAALNFAISGAESLSKMDLCLHKDDPYVDRIQRMALMLLAEELTEAPIDANLLRQLSRLGSLEEIKRLGARLHLVVKGIENIRDIALEGDPSVMGAIPLVMRWAESCQTISWLSKEINDRRLPPRILDPAARQILEVPEHFEVLKLRLLTTLLSPADSRGDKTTCELGLSSPSVQQSPNDLFVCVYDVLEFLNRPDLVDWILERLPSERRDSIMSDVSEYGYENLKRMVKE